MTEFMRADVKNGLAIIRFLKRNPGRRTKATIAKALNRELRTFENLLQRLGRCGLISGKRGPDGGHELTEAGKTADVYTLIFILLPYDDLWLMNLMREAKGKKIETLSLVVNPDRLIQPKRL